MRAYLYIEDDKASCHEPHCSEEEKDILNDSDLKAMGVTCRKFSGPTAENDLKNLAEELGYKNMDEVIISKEALGEKYEGLIEKFFEEHLHEDDEIRYILDGAGYFDIRSKEDKWVRIHTEKDDMLVIPAFSYHRFTVDTDGYVKARRLFKDAPKWVAIPRTEAENAQTVST